MKVKELIEELKKYDWELEVRCYVRDEVLYYWWEDVNDGIEDKNINEVKEELYHFYDDREPELYIQLR